jgi:uncharacterized protein
LRDKFGWSEEALTIAKERIADFAEIVTPAQNIDAVKEDPTDNRILECAVTGASDYLVSGDRHLLNIGQYQGFKIVSPAELVEIQAQLGRGRTRG